MVFKDSFKFFFVTSLQGEGVGRLLNKGKKPDQVFDREKYCSELTSLDLNVIFFFAFGVRVQRDYLSILNYELLVVARKVIECVCWTN